jgi:DNA-binding SARP family transcriptional activator
VLAGTGAQLIQRQRLDSAFASARVVLLEAPGGYGKSTAAATWARTLDLPTLRVVLRTRQEAAALVASIAVAARRAGLPFLAEATDPEDAEASFNPFLDRLGTAEPLLITVDEAQRAIGSAAQWLADLATELPSQHRLLVAGRRLPQVIRDLVGGAGARLFTVTDLRFDSAETAAILAAAGVPARPDEVNAILAATDGWPAAVVLAARTGVEGVATELDEPVDGVLRGLVERLVAAAGPSVGTLLAAVSQLPLISAETAAAVGGDGALDVLLEAGLPIRFRADGWGELPDPVREATPAISLTPDVARAVATNYAAHGELSEGVALLHRIGDHAGVAALLATQPRGRLGRSGLALFDAIVAAIPDDVLAAHPQAIVQLVRAAERLPRLRAHWIERGLAALPADSVERRAVQAEDAMNRARAGDLQGGTAQAKLVVENSGPTEVVTLGRAHLCLGLCLIVGDTAGAGEAAREEFELAVGHFQLANERDWEAEAQQALGFGVLFYGGAIEAGATSLERALSLRSTPNVARAQTLTFLAEVLVYAGRFEDAAVALREAREIGQRFGDERTLGYAAWSSALMSGMQGDRDAAISALEEAERHPGGWFDQLAGLDFLAQSSEIRAMVGDSDGARRDLERAEKRAAGTSRDGRALPARVRLEAMYGDPAAALSLFDQLAESPFANANDRWRVPLLKAAAHARLGQVDLASNLVRTARQLAAEQNDPDLLARQERRLLALAEPSAEPASDTAATIVRVLGGFAVDRAGEDVSPAPGRPATLVKMVAVLGSVSLDQAIDQLWPETDLEEGRPRMRNLLHRIRATSGDVLVRTEGALELGPGVQVDAERFERDARTALAAPQPSRAGLARVALSRSTGELLPADQFADWTIVPRERIRRRYLALLDLVSEDAIARGDFDEADRLLDEAITVEPLDESRYVRLATSLIAQGRLLRARRVADQAVAVARDLGVEPSDELVALLGKLAAV